LVVDASDKEAPLKVPLKVALKVPLLLKEMN
jgi:hypothetical protein